MSGKAKDNYCSKGDFKPIDKEKNDGRINSLKRLDAEIIGDGDEIIDPDSKMNEDRDSHICLQFGFDCINTDKHGLDGKRSQTGEYAEIKNSSLFCKKPCAVFNDTSLEKARAFQSGNIYTILTLWNGFGTPKLAIITNNPEIGVYLEERVIYQTKKSQRRTQSISARDLKFKYEGQVVCINSTKEEARNILISKYSKFKELSTKEIMTLEEYSEAIGFDIIKTEAA